MLEKGKREWRIPLQKFDGWRQCGEGDLVGLGIAFRIGRFQVQTPLDARPGSVTQPRYEVPDDLQVEIVETQ